MNANAALYEGTDSHNEERDVLQGSETEFVSNFSCSYKLFVLFTGRKVTRSKLTAVISFDTYGVCVYVTPALCLGLCLCSGVRMRDRQCAYNVTTRCVRCCYSGKAVSIPRFE